ncbi:MAG: aldehyde oxidase, partial [Synergistetes bacterium HGW-Synergistetes-2]
YALTEQYIFNSKGKMTNNSFWDYKLFGTLDMPEMKTIVVDSDEPTGPYGAKSISEIGINGPAPAIANAIYDAVGVRIYDLPLTPEKVLKAIRARTDG